MRRFLSALLFAITSTACAGADDSAPPPGSCEASGGLLSTLSFQTGALEIGGEAYLCFGFDASPFAGRHVMRITWAPPQGGGVALHHATLYASSDPFPAGPTPCEEMPPDSPPPEDSGLRDQLAEHLALLKREGTIQTWHTAELRPGQEVQPAILREIDEAGVILLLISSSYQASDDCFDVQMKRALDRHAKGTAIVLPILLRPCDWESAPYARLPVLPGNRRAVTQWDHPDEAFMAIAAGIREALGARAQAKAAVEPAPVAAGAEKVHPGVEHLFVGRAEEMAELERVLLPGSPMHI